MLKAVLALALVGAASAVCPNSCSGHGTCGADDICTCYQNWGMADEASGDCSEMICPFEFAWVDKPDVDGTFHKYAECSGKGICDRSTGECECFDGYGGKGCQRMTCPNDCSGHGTCEYIEELTFGASSGAYFGRVVPDVAHTAEASVQSIVKSAKTFSDTADELWDFHKSMACTCDPGYIEVDCSRRMCPKANDVMDERLNIADAMKYQIQNITLYAAGNDGQGNSSEIHEFYGKSFALTFISTLNESFTTIPIDIGYDTSVTVTENNLADHITASLKGLPNKVITNVNVNTTLGYETRTAVTNVAKSADIAFLNIEVEFVGASTMGPQHLLTVEAEKCAIGCTPRIKGLDLMSVDTKPTNSAISFVTEKQAADYNNYECGRRGKCDYDKGLCECFEGFTGEACSIQTALV
jgi:hypothetical protein